MDDKSRWRGRYGLWLLGAALLSGCQLQRQPAPQTVAPPLATGNGTMGAPRQAQQTISDPASVQPAAAAVGVSGAGVGAALPLAPIPVSSAPVPAQPAAAPFPIQPVPGVVSTAGYPPPPIPFLQPGVNVTPSPTLPPAARGTASGPSVTFVDAGPTNDVHQLQTPTANGAILGLTPGDHPIERAAIVTQQLRQEQEDKRILEAREQQLKAELAQREKSLREATYEVKEATEEIHRTRAAVQAALQETEEKMAALRKREQADIATVKEILKKLDHTPEGSAVPVPTPTPENHAPMRP